MRESNTLYLLSLLFKLFSLITSKTLTLNTFVIDNSFYIQYHKSLEEDVLFTQINQQLPFSWFNSKFLSKSAFKIIMNGDEKLLVFSLNFLFLPTIKSPYLFLKQFYHINCIISYKIWKKCKKINYIWYLSQ